MNATRRHGGKRVMHKRIYPDEGLHELITTQLFSSPATARDPRNHRMPLLDIIKIPKNGQKLGLMIMPFLHRFNDPRFQSFGEFVVFFTQICEARSFKHPRHEPILINILIRVSNSCTSGTSHTGTRGRLKMLSNF